MIGQALIAWTFFAPMNSAWKGVLPILIGAVAIWLSLPPGRRAARVAGVALGLIALGLLASQSPGLPTLSETAVFWILAGVTLAAAAATVCVSNPVYSAIWFALSTLGTAGLFLFQGAQFLGVATIVVYAGAIVVTFLFVLMLAQPAGRATFDRLSWGRFPQIVSVIAAASLVSLLSFVLMSMRQEGLGPPSSADYRGGALREQVGESLTRIAAAQGQTIRADALLRAKMLDSRTGHVLQLTFRQAPWGAREEFDKLEFVKLLARDPPAWSQLGNDLSFEVEIVPVQQNTLHAAHVAHLGAELYSRHILSVEVAGALLLVALVGAIAMVIQGKSADEEDGLADE